MRSHRDIIHQAGTRRFHDALALNGKENTVRAWVQRNSIPAEYWARVVAAGLATLEELAAGAAAKKFSPAKPAEGRAA